MPGYFRLCQFFRLILLSSSKNKFRSGQLTSGCQVMSGYVR